MTMSDVLAAVLAWSIASWAAASRSTSSRVVKPRSDRARVRSPSMNAALLAAGPPGRRTPVAAQPPADQSPDRRPDRGPGDTQASHELDFGGDAVADPVVPADQQVLQDLLRLRVQRHPAQRGGSIAG